MRGIFRTGVRLAGIAVAAVCPLAPAAQDFDSVRIQTVDVAAGLHMLVGQGGNIGVSTGEDGIFLIDDQFAPLTAKIRTAIAEIQEGPIRFLLNTHWHADHTGGNENLGRAGAVIVAHAAVRTRMSTEQFMSAANRRIPPAPPAALPVVTFAETISFHLNGDEIRVLHVPSAHTDGDSIVQFVAANAVHTGDTYFNIGGFPFIDLSSGGSLEGMIAAADRVLALANDRTRILPGHGPLSNRAELRTYRDMLVLVRDRVSRAIDALRRNC